MNKTGRRLSCYFSRKKYEVLVVSFLVLLFGDTFSHQPAMLVILPLQHMLVAWIAFFESKKLRLIIGALILSVTGIALFNCCDFTQLGVGLICAAYFLYFIVIAIKVYHKIFSLSSVSSEMIAAVLCGFILLCLAAAIMFITIEINYPQSFKNISSGPARFVNLTYFSFTTLLTIGYGDIVPLTLLAKRAVMLMGLAGHFYTVFLTGIIIGKYLQGKQEVTT